MSPAERRLSEMGVDTADAPLARLASGGSGEAQRLAAAMLHARFGRLTVGVGRRVAMEVGAVEDVVQVALLAMVESFGSFDPAKGTLARWVARCVEGAVRNASRAGRRHRQRLAAHERELVAVAGLHINPDGKGELVDHVDNPQDRIQKANLHAQISLAINGLESPLAREAAWQLYNAGRVDRALLASRHGVSSSMVDRAREQAWRTLADLAAQLGLKARQRARVIRLPDRAPVPRAPLNESKAA